MSRVFKKNDFVVERCRNKTVLDLGCIQHDVYESHISTGQWLHKLIKGVASELVGVDLLEEDGKKLNKMGFNMFMGMLSI